MLKSKYKIGDILKCTINDKTHYIKILGIINGGAVETHTYKIEHLTDTIVNNGLILTRGETTRLNMYNLENHNTVRLATKLEELLYA